MAVVSLTVLIILQHLGQSLSTLYREIRRNLIRLSVTKEDVVTDRERSEIAVLAEQGRDLSMVEQGVST
jgi:IS30 family transposase